MCFERLGTEEIPGCGGAGSLGRDYCFERPENYLWKMGDNGLPQKNFPLGNCEGDCDKDADCAGGLLCFERNGLEEVLGCEGSGLDGKDYCFERPENYLWIMGDNGLPQENFPLGNCEGDCDNDADCAEGLTCFQRNGLEEVLGCEGSGQKGKDYCYFKPTPPPTPAPIPLPVQLSPVSWI